MGFRMLGSGFSVSFFFGLVSRFLVSLVSSLGISSLGSRSSGFGLSGSHAPVHDRKLLMDSSLSIHSLSACGERRPQ